METMGGAANWLRSAAPRPLQVHLVAANFDGHKFTDTITNRYIKLGFVIGGKASLTKRITVDYDPKKKGVHRKDVAEGTELLIKGFSDKGVVVACSADFGGKTKTVDWSVKAELLTPVGKKTAAAVAAKSVSDKQQSVFKKFKFLATDDEKKKSLDICTVDGWENALMTRDNRISSEYGKANVMFAIQHLKKIYPDPKKDDILIVKRGDKHEAWSMKDFSAGQLVLVPESVEIKARFFTQDRSAICKNTKDPQSLRPLVIDGRVRANPNPSAQPGSSGATTSQQGQGQGASQSFSLFWLVERVADPKEANMSLRYSAMSMKIDVWGGLKRVEKALSEGDCPSVPLLINDKKIAKHTRILAVEDLGIKKMHDEQQKEIAAKKSEQLKQQKDDGGKRKADAKEGEGSKGTKKAKAKAKD